MYLIVLLTVRCTSQCEWHQCAGRLRCVHPAAAIIGNSLKTDFAQPASQFCLQGAMQECASPFSCEAFDPLRLALRVVEMGDHIRGVSGANIHSPDKLLELVDGQPIHDQLIFTVTDGGDGRLPERTQVTNGEIRQGNGALFHNAVAGARTCSARNPVGSAQFQKHIIGEIIGIDRMVLQQLLAQLLTGVAVEI